MKPLALLAIVSLLASAPASLAQMPAKRLSAGGTCPAPAQEAQRDALVSDAIAPEETAAPAPANGCQHCDDHYHMPTRWHRFLPGMFR